MHYIEAPITDNNFLINGKGLKFYIEIGIQGLLEERVESGARKKKKDDPLRMERLELLSHQMKSLMDKGDFDTVHLRTKTKSFPALKNVLAGQKTTYFNFKTG